MSCRIGRIIIVKNEGTVIIGNVNHVSPSDSSTTTEGSGEEITGEDLRDIAITKKPASAQSRSRNER